MEGTAANLPAWERKNSDEYKLDYLVLNLIIITIFARRQFKL